MKIDRETQDKWILGDTIPGVLYRMQAHVKVIIGAHSGTLGELISLCAATPEPIYHLETLGGDDIYVRQSEIVLA